MTAAIARKVSSENGFSASQDEVLVTCGAKDAIHQAMEAVLNPEDEALILDPSWVSYEPCVRLAGAGVRHHALDPVAFQVDDTLLEAVSPRTKVIVVNTPSNPSGAVLDADSLRLIADICSDHDLYALSDEIYEKLVYRKEHISSPHFQVGRSGRSPSAVSKATRDDRLADRLRRRSPADHPQWRRCSTP